LLLEVARMARRQLFALQFAEARFAVDDKSAAMIQILGAMLNIFLSE
jgi:hypothetical protein